MFKLGMSVLLSIVSELCFWRLSWLGHLGRMANDRLPKHLLFSEVPGHELRGFSRKKWLQLLQADLDHIRIRYSWYACCQDRNSCRDALETVHT